MIGYNPDRQQEAPAAFPRKMHATRRPQKQALLLFFSLLMVGSFLLMVMQIIGSYALFVKPHTTGKPAPTNSAITIMAAPTATPTPTPIPFDPAVGAVLPQHRVVAFYAVPGAEATGPAFQLTAGMLSNLRTQAQAYQQLDPQHPVQAGIDLVASVPDGFPGPEGFYSHHLDPETIQAYINFCSQNNLILFLDLNFGRAPVMEEVNFFLPYLEKYAFVHMAIDPEWMFPRHDGVPGVNLSNVRASDINPIIQALAEIPMQYHVPRKILMIHQYRGDGDGLAKPFDAGRAEIADKRNLLSDPRVDVVVHIDSVGGYVGSIADKTAQYENWVGQDMQKYHNFSYGGFKLFYHIEAKTLMTPKQVLALQPAPMMITYGN